MPTFRPFRRLTFVAAALLTLSACVVEGPGSSNCIPGTDFCQPGTCTLVDGDRPDQVRIHIINSDDVANIRVTVAVGGETCVIDELFTCTDAGCELGQAVYSLPQGTVVSFSAMSGSAEVAWSCTAKAAAATSGSAYTSLFWNSSMGLCEEGFETGSPF